VDMASQHSVIHRKSLAYTMFVRAAKARDDFFGYSKVGDFSATQQRYFTGISHKRYLGLLLIEYPIICLITLVSYASIPLSFFYMVLRVAQAKVAGTMGGWESLGFMAEFFGLTLLLTMLVMALWMAVLSWARSGPNRITKILKRHFTQYHVDLIESPEKFPGPIQLFKKWLLSSAEAGPAQITWDSGRKDRS